MLHWPRKHFIPHDGNDHQPHFLRSDTVQTLLIVLLIVQAFFLIFAFLVIPQSQQVAAVIASSLVEQTNAVRSQKHVAILSTNEKLQASAQLKANDMALRGYFAHDAPDGTQPWYWFKRAGYAYQFAGENLAVNFIESRDVTSAWMQSPTHRENLLSGKYTEMGIATALGKYKGKDAIFVVQHFGRPLPQEPLTTTIQNTSENLMKNGTGKAAVLGATSERTGSIFGAIMNAPKRIALGIQLTIALLTVTALLLAFFIKVRVQHPLILANGVVLTAITVGLALMNSVITQGTI